MDEASEDRDKARALRRWVPLIVVAVALVLFFALGLGRYLTFEALAEHREWLLRWVMRLGFLAPVVFIAVYAALVAVSVRGYRARCARAHVAYAGILGLSALAALSPHKAGSEAGGQGPGGLSVFKNRDREAVPHSVAPYRSGLQRD